MKKLTQEAAVPASPPMLPKRDQRTPSPKSFGAKKDYQHYHYRNKTTMSGEQ